MELRVHVRWMIRRDMAEVLAIENECFDEPWDEEDFLRALRQRNCIGMVAEVGMGGPVVGHMIYELHKTRLHLLNFAVHPARQMKGVGRQMVDRLKGKLTDDRRTRLALEIRDNNLDGQLFFRALGFKATGVLREFYPNGVDAYAMEYLYRSSVRQTQGANP